MFIISNSTLACYGFASGDESNTRSSSYQLPFICNRQHLNTFIAFYHCKEGPPRGKLICWISLNPNSKIVNCLKLKSCITIRLQFCVWRQKVEYMFGLSSQHCRNVLQKRSRSAWYERSGASSAAKDWPRQAMNVVWLNIPKLSCQCKSSAKYFGQF